MKFVPNAVSSKFARQLLIGQKHSPTILFAAGIGGFVVTTVLAAKATLSIEAILDEHGLETEDRKEAKKAAGGEYSDLQYRKDMTRIHFTTAGEIVRLYGPAVLVGGLSIGALTGSHHTLSKRNAGLTAAYAALDKGFKEYRARVEDSIGEDKERKLYANANVEEVKVDPKTGKSKTIKKVGPDSCSIYARFFDDRSKSWNNEPTYNLVFLRCQQNYMNDLLQSRGHVFLNEVYDCLGIERSTEGAVVGWVKGQGDDNIDFGVFNSHAKNEFFDFVTGAENCILLDFNVDGVIYDKI